MREEERRGKETKERRDLCNHVQKISLLLIDFKFILNKQVKNSFQPKVACNYDT